MVARITLRLIKIGLLAGALWAGVLCAERIRTPVPPKAFVANSITRNTHRTFAVRPVKARQGPTTRYSIYASEASQRYAVQYQHTFEFEKGVELRDGLVITGRTPHRMILFTFDDGPDAVTTPALLDRLDAADVRAVFFLSTERIRGRTAWERKQIEVAKEIPRRGHIVASHGLHHVQLVLLSDAQLTYEFETAEDVFLRIFGERPWLFRPPGGARSPRIDAAIAARGYTTVLWNLGTGDVQVRSAEEVLTTFQRVLERRESEQGDFGGIVLLHDIHSWSVEAFELIYRDLLSRNCALLQTDEELYDFVADPTWFYVPRVDAEVGVMAPPAEPPLEVWKARQERIRGQTYNRCQKEFQLAGSRSVQTPHG